MTDTKPTKTQQEETFQDLLDASIPVKQGQVTQGTIVDISSGRVTVNAQLKSDAIIPLEEFTGEEIAVGDEVDLVIESLENGFGETRLSRKNARRAKMWDKLSKLQEAGETVYGKIVERVKGGFTVNVDSILAFLPGSLVDVRPVRDLGYLEDKELEFKIIKMDLKRNNIVLSRRAVIEGGQTVDRAQRIEALEEGQEVTGIVKNVTNYGAFIDLGGVDGLLHITDIAWKRVKHPSDHLEVGQELTVKVMKVDKDKQRVSLGLKQLANDPWRDISTRYPIGNKVQGHISNVTDYGCFVELETGVEGLVHMSEMDWTNKNVHPSRVVEVGQAVEVMVLDVDESRRRVSLGIKQCTMNPWQKFATEHALGEKVTGNIRSITDFGIFVGLEGGIDGLIHISDLSWSKLTEQDLQQYQKGQELEAVILSIDAARERISLGVKQMTENPSKSYAAEHDKGETLQAKVLTVESERASLEIDADINGELPLAEYSHDADTSLTEKLKVGDVIDVRIIDKDEATGNITLSRKATLEPKTQPKPKPAANVKMTLGDLLKEQMDAKDKDKDKD